MRKHLRARRRAPVGTLALLLAPLDAGGGPRRIPALLPALFAALWAPAVEADRAGAPSARWAGAAALMERIEGETAELEALAAAQAELLEWNAERAAAGLAPAALSPEVCIGEVLEAWCALLPATFGAVPGNGAGGQAHGGR